MASCQKLREKDLDVDLHRGWLTPLERSSLFNTLTTNVTWHRVKYRSARFGNECTTPCWTAFYGGASASIKPYLAVPQWLMPLVAKVSAACGGAKFNSMLVRMYWDGSDAIAWHTDGRTFLGSTPTIAE